MPKLLFELAELDVGWILVFQAKAVFPYVEVGDVGHILPDGRILYLDRSVEILQIKDEASTIVGQKDALKELSCAIATGRLFVVNVCEHIKLLLVS